MENVIFILKKAILQKKQKVNGKNLEGFYW